MHRSTVLIGEVEKAIKRFTLHLSNRKKKVLHQEMLFFKGKMRPTVLLISNNHNRGSKLKTRGIENNLLEKINKKGRLINK